MTFDPSYEGEVKVTIIATGFPEVTQEEIIKGKSNSSLGMFGQRVGVRKTKGEDFINRAVKKEGLDKKVQTFLSVDEEDDETPAFIKRKLR
jgi:hypothetical protein